jgi:hypothetical protein
MRPQAIIFSVLATPASTLALRAYAYYLFERTLLHVLGHVSGTSLWPVPLLATILYPAAAKTFFLPFPVGGLLADILQGFFSNVKALGLFGYFVYSLAFVYGCSTITV